MYIYIINYIKSIICNLNNLLYTIIIDLRIEEHTITYSRIQSIYSYYNTYEKILIFRKINSTEFKIFVCKQLIKYCIIILSIIMKDNEEKANIKSLIFAYLC